MDICTFEELFQQIRTGLLFCGVSSVETKIFYRYHIMNTSLIIMLTGELGFFIVNYSPENLLELTKLMPCFCIGILSILKIMPIVAYRQNIFELTKSLNHLHSTVIKKSNISVLIQNNMLAMKKFQKYFVILNVVLVSVYNFLSLIVMALEYVKTKNVIFHLPYGIILPFSTENWLNWCIVYIYSIANAIISVLFFTTVDGLYCVLTLLICNNFTVLSDEIQRLDETNTYLIRRLVIDHQNILKLSEDLEEIFRLPNLFSVFVGSLEICALGFNLTMGDWSEVPGCILFLLSVLLQILMMSIFGENIIRESQKVGECAFLSKWYDMDVKSKKMILIIMKRSSKAQKLTAYKFSIICYESFTKIISTSWSYFTILRTVYKPPE